jgi:excisionase family DNA binding protein
MLIGTSEAAMRLKISERRLRALLDDGRIPALRVSGRWVIDAADLARYGFPRLPGRPLSQRSAWQLARFASSAVTQVAGNDGPSPIERHRLKLRLLRLHDSSDPLSLVSSLLARRAERVELSAAQSDIAQLLQDPRLRLSGVSHSAAGLLSNSEVEAYVDCRDHKALVKEWLLVSAAPGRRSNVVLHVADNVPEDLPLMLVVADLAERPGVRERAAALEIISRLKA